MSKWRCTQPRARCRAIRIREVLRGAQGVNVVALEVSPFHLSLLAMSASASGLTYVDVDDELQRDILRVTQTLPPEATQSPNLVTVLRTPEVRNIVQDWAIQEPKWW